MTQAMLHRPPKYGNTIISAVTKILRQVHLIICHAARKDLKNLNAFRYKHDLKSKETILVRINGLFLLINIIKTESNNLLSNHT